jgi:uncharacterized membrane protein YfcA
VGAAVHLRRGRVSFKLVGWMVLGSVPAALLGTWLLHEMGHTKTAEKHIQILLGTALLVGGVAMIVRAWMDRRSGSPRRQGVHELRLRPLASVLIGIVGGLIVGMTSVGSGSLMIVLLLFVYPTISANDLVGTDLAQAVPLTLAAAIGALIFGTISFGVTTSLILGSVPAVFVGAHFSSRAPDGWIRPIITFVILASGLKYVGVGTTQLGWCLVAMLAGAFVLWLLARRGRRELELLPALEDFEI